MSSSSLSSIVVLVLLVCMTKSTTSTGTITKQDFVGSWKQIETENIDAFLEKIGVGWFTRKAVSLLNPKMIISIDGDKWKIEQKSTFRDIEWEFELDKEYGVTSADGREVKSTFTFVDGKLIHVEKAKTPGDVDSKVVRSIENDKIVTILNAEGVVAKQVFERVISD